MKVDYISDIHIDTHTDKYNVKSLESWARTVIGFDPQKAGDVLLIAGDIGHSNRQNLGLLMMFASHYKHVYIVPGNHDRYLIPRHEPDMTANGPDTRVDDLGRLIEQYLLDNVHLLLGTTHTFEGITFGGTGGWYDNSFIESALIEAYWQSYMNDSNWIPGLELSIGLLELEIGRVVQALSQGVDVMITHISPSNRPDNIPYEYRDDILTNFYCFDGEALIKKYKPRYWIYGHQHTGLDYKVGKTQVLTNACGYGHVYPHNKIKSFTLHQKGELKTKTKRVRKKK